MYTDATSFIKITSPNQFEISVDYMIQDRSKKKIEYTLGIYLFVPENLGINASTYTQERFYSDRISYVRLWAPERDFGTIASQFMTVIASIDARLDAGKKPGKLSGELKRMITSYTRALREATEAILAAETIETDAVSRVIETGQKMLDVEQAILALRDKAVRDKDCFLFESASEYLSLTTQHFLFKLTIRLRREEEQYREWIHAVLKQINRELRFCKMNGFPIVSSDDNTNERVIYRYSVFKKFFFRVLHLQQERKEDGTSIKEFYYAVAAGISMVFTTIVVFASQKEYGNFTLSFFMALVISYMFKDRLKEAYRSYFDRKLHLKTYDYKEKIYDRSQQKRILASTKERMRFVKKSDLEAAVVETRLQGVSNRLSTWYLGEAILKYEKHVTLYNKHLQEYHHSAISGLHNILRFDLSSFLPKMDSRKVPLYRVNREKIFGDKVYHVNVVVAIVSEQETFYRKARIVLTRKGIKRIELPAENVTLYPEKFSADADQWFPVKKSGLLKSFSSQHYSHKTKIQQETPSAVLRKNPKA